jgi:hypothetical protein
LTKVILPPPIDALVKAINDGNTERLFGLLAPDACVDDWGSKYDGIDEIRTWNERELIGAKGRLTVTSVERTGDRVVLLTDWKSNFFTGPGRFTFKIENGKIKEWRITEV